MKTTRQGLPAYQSGFHNGPLPPPLTENCHVKMYALARQTIERAGVFRYDNHTRMPGPDRTEAESGEGIALPDQDVIFTSARHVFGWCNRYGDHVAEPDYRSSLRRQENRRGSRRR